MYCISVTLYILGCDMGEVGAMSSRRRGVICYLQVIVVPTLSIAGRYDRDCGGGYGAAGPER
jgi:hypothetical protein